jgi:hypothetical protein
VFDLKLPTEHVNLDGHLSVGDMYLFAFSKTCIFPAIVVTVNKTYKNGLRLFLTLPMKEVETVAVQLLKAPHANSLYQHYMYYLCRRPQSLVYKMLSPECLATPNDYTGMISMSLSERLEETLIAYKQRLPAIIGAMNQA